MKNMKKIAAVLAALTLSMTAFTACGGSSAPAETTPAPTEAPTEAATEAPTEAATEAATEAETEAATEEETVDEEFLADAQALIDAVANTVWLGMDTDYNCYVLAFGQDEIYFASDMSDDDVVEGYWDISMDATHIYIYSDADLTEEIGGLDWAYDEETDTMVIKDSIVMAQTDADSLEDAAMELEKMSVAKTVAEAMNGTYWMGQEDDGTYEVLYMEDDVMVWATFDNEAKTEVNTYYWGMDYENITLYDADYNEIVALGWNAKTDLSTLTITLDDASVELTQTDEASAEEIFGTMLAVSDVVASAQAEAAAGSYDDADLDADDAGLELDDDADLDDADLDFSSLS